MISFAAALTICGRFHPQLILSLLLLAALLVAFSAKAATTQYYYDDLGRVVQAISTDGSVQQYQYDTNGNVLVVNRVNATTLTISGLAPLVGRVGANVTISGAGFSATPGNNVVKFGAVTATVVSATPSSIVATVPVGAVTGPVSVTVGGNTATSAMSYVVRYPAISSFAPLAVLPGNQVTLSGNNLNLVPGSTTVAVGGVPATIVSIINTQIVFTAPAGMQTNQIQVSTSYGNVLSAASLILTPGQLVSANVVASTMVATGGATGSINIPQAGKQGAFTFNAVAGQFLTLQITSLTTGAPNNVGNQIYTPTNTLLSSPTLGWNQRTIHLPKIATTGTYMVVFWSGDGPMQVSAKLEVDNQIDAIQDFAVSTELVGQSKRMTFDATAGASMSFAVTGLTLAPANGNITVVVFRPNGSELSSMQCATNAPNNCHFYYRNLPTTGKYQIGAFLLNTNATMSYTLRLAPVVSTTLALDTPYSLNLGIAGQVGLLNFSVSAGQTIALNATSITSAPLNKNIYLAVLDASGTQVTYASHSVGPNLNLRNLPAGNYTLAVYATDALTATMQVTMASGITGVLPVDGTSSAFSTTVKSQQVFATFTATAGESVAIGMTNMSMAPSGGQIVMTVLRPNGSGLNEIYCPLNTLPGCQMHLRPLPTTGTYTIVLTPTTLATINATLRVSPPVAATLTPESPYGLTLGTPGQFAMLTFTATAGQTFAISASSITTAPLNRNVNLVLLGPNGSQIASSWHAASPYINAANLAAGTHTLLVYTNDAATSAMQINLAAGVVDTLPVDGTAGTYSTTLIGQNAYLKFAATAGQSVAVGVTNMAKSPTGGQIFFNVYLPNGSTLASLPCTVSTLPGCQLQLRNLPTTGTYTIAASSDTLATMSFTLRVSPAVTTTLALDTPYSLNLGVPGQFALLNFTATAGQTVAISGSSITTAPLNRALNMVVYGPTGAQVSSTSSASSPIMNLPDLPAGTYTLMVSTTNASTSVSQINLATGAAATLSVDGPSSSYATTLNGQAGYFKFAATAGQSIGIGITNITKNPSGNLIIFTAYAPSGGALTGLNCTPTALPGCQMQLRNLPVTGTYTLVATNDTLATMGFTLHVTSSVTTTLSAGTPYALTLGTPGQFATLKFTATAGQTFALSAESIVTAPLNRNVTLTAFGPTGTQVGVSTHQTEPILNLPYLAAGVHTVMVNTTSASTSAMQVNLAAGAGATLPVDGSGGSYSTTLKGQNGYFKFAATAGQWLGVGITDISKSPSGGDIIFYYYLPTGGGLTTQVCSSTSVPGCRLQLRNMPSTGTYSIVAANDSLGTMGFTLHLSHPVAGTLVLNTPQSLSLTSPGQFGKFSFTATANQSISISASSITTSPAGKSVEIVLFDTSGNQLQNTGSTTNPVLSRSNFTAGTYTVVFGAVSAATATMQVQVQ